MGKNNRRTSVIIVLIVFAANLIASSAIDFLYCQEKENKEGDNEREQAWNVSSAAHYYSRYTRYGIDLSEDRPAFSIESEIGHEYGLSAGFEAFALTGANGGYEHSAFHFGYEYSLNTGISFTGTYTYYSYATDTLSVLDGISNTILLGGTLKVSGAILSASYVAYFGGGTANYISTGASANYEIGRLRIVPSIQLSFASQTVSDSLLPKNRGKGKGNKNGTGSVLTTTVTGMSNLTICMAFRYPLGKDFAISAMPSYVYSPTDLAVRTNQVILIIGLEHSIDF